MRQLNYLGTHNVAWLEAPYPKLEAEGDAIVRPLVVSTCDFDGAVIAGVARLRGPVPLGHEGVGVVEAIGARVASVRVGERVIIPWKVSCGTCTACARGFTAQCQTVVPEDAYGWGPTSRERGGFLADAVRVPYADHMLLPLPDDVDPRAACGVADNISDAWRAVGPQLAARPGGSVLVTGNVGPGSIGLYAAGIAVALGATRVCYVDHSATRLQISALFDAEPVPLAQGEPFPTFQNTFDVRFRCTKCIAARSRSLPGGRTRTASFRSRSNSSGRAASIRLRRRRQLCRGTTQHKR